jgi:chorismate dehydratase
MPFRIAAVSYLNSWPLVEGLTRLPAEEAELTMDVPSRLADRLYADEADVALIPVIEYLRGTGATIVPGAAIATTGPVDSVKLFTRVAPAAIGRVLVDKASRTSVALLRILLAEIHGIRPDFYAGEPNVEELLRNEEAALVIGDPCFDAERRFRSEKNDGVQIIDLGAAWVKMTGLPFVFATWVLGRRFAAGAPATEQARLCRMLLDSRDQGVARIDELADRAVAEGKLGPGGESVASAIRHYFRHSLRFKLGERELAGLRRYQELCVKHAICPPGRAPQATMTACE